MLPWSCLRLNRLDNDMREVLEQHTDHPSHIPRVGSRWEFMGLGSGGFGSGHEAKTLKCHFYCSDAQPSGHQLWMHSTGPAHVLPAVEPSLPHVAVRTLTSAFPCARGDGGSLPTRSWPHQGNTRARFLNGYPPKSSPPPGPYWADILTLSPPVEHVARTREWRSLDEATRWGAETISHIFNLLQQGSALGKPDGVSLPILFTVSDALILYFAEEEIETQRLRSMFKVTGMYSAARMRSTRTEMGLYRSHP
ncbi:uncharacterized protein LOC125126128 isoform X2 [Phacochoerus africanus]|uniref:uncharacterized protein LOC125126128 isoform X2 n=1 Tax=Phacochoerus africanus TaxID=41426 RepID=UPI001FD95C56|nr:uncharacterized protein LOC125126128 isoform X2 [Phacochoerus africanus]